MIKYDKYLFDFIPITIIVLFVFYHHQMIQMSNSILGKLLAIIIILYYTNEDILYGIITCLIIILYYQSDHFACWTNPRLCKEAMTNDDIFNHHEKINNNTETIYYDTPIVDTAVEPTIITSNNISDIIMNYTKSLI